MTKLIKTLIISVCLFAATIAGCSCKGEITTQTEVITSTITSISPTTIVSTVFATTTQTVTDTSIIVQGYESAPVPSFNDVRGAIVGRVLLENGEPAYMYYVLVFIGSAYYGSVYYTDQNGYYSVSNVNPDVCRIYVMQSEPMTDITWEPDAVVTPLAGTITTVPDIIYHVAK